MFFISHRQTIPIDWKAFKKLLIIKKKKNSIIHILMMRFIKSLYFFFFFFFLEFRLFGRATYSSLKHIKKY